MDKTIEIVLVVVVALVTASIIVFLVQGRAGIFGDFLDTQSNSGQCELINAKISSTCNNKDNADKLSDLQSRAQEIKGCQPAQPKSC